MKGGVKVKAAQVECEIDPMMYGHYCSRCYHPLFVFNQFGDCEGAVLRPGNVYSAEG